MEIALFFLTHNIYPGHTPNTGKCRPDENQRYFERMKKANLEMEKDILNIKENNQDSIIILLGDHGPYLTKNCRELRNYDISKP